MQSIDLIRDNLGNSTRLVLSRIEEMREHGFVASAAARNGDDLLFVYPHDEAP